MLAISAPLLPRAHRQGGAGPRAPVCAHTGGRRYSRFERARPGVAAGSSKPNFRAARFRVPMHAPHQINAAASHPRPAMIAGYRI